MEGYTSSFSAIIMDDAYYDFAVSHSEIVGDIRILKPEALIVLKAVAFWENLRRKDSCDGNARFFRTIEEFVRVMMPVFYSR